MSLDNPSDYRNLQILEYLPRDIVENVVSKYTAELYPSIEQFLIDQVYGYYDPRCPDYLERDAQYIYKSLEPFRKQVEEEFVFFKDTGNMPDYDSKEFQELFLVVDEVLIRVSHFPRWVANSLHKTRSVNDFITLYDHIKNIASVENAVEILIFEAFLQDVRRLEEMSVM